MCVIAAMASLGGRQGPEVLRLVSYWALAPPPSSHLAAQLSCARLAELRSIRAVVSNARKRATQRARSLHLAAEQVALLV